MKIIIYQNQQVSGKEGWWGKSPPFERIVKSSQLPQKGHCRVEIPDEENTKHVYLLEKKI